MSCICEPGQLKERNGHTATCNRLSRKLDTDLAKNEQRSKAKLEALKQPKKKQEPIAKVSGKMAKLLQVYTQKKQAWIRGKRCAVFPSRPATEIHHAKGKNGYADKWARDNDIPLLIDERFWIPLSSDGMHEAHRLIEENPNWAKEMGYSKSRLEKKEYAPLTEQEKQETENLL